MIKKMACIEYNKFFSNYVPINYIVVVYLGFRIILTHNSLSKQYKEELGMRIKQK